MFEWKASNAVFLDENTGGKGKYFRARILQAGLVKYSFGVCLLEKDTIDKFIYEFVGCPVIIDHKDVTNENAKEERVGVISRVWFEQMDGWFWVEGVIFEEEAISLINDGYNVSCQYEISEYANNIGNQLHNGNPYDKVILNGKPEHLAIVKNPRYENAMIAVNALDATNKDDEDGRWITVKGTHVFIKKGQSVEEALKQKNLGDLKEAYDLRGKYEKEDVDFDVDQLKKDIAKAQDLGFEEVEEIATFLGLDEDEVRETLAAEDETRELEDEYSDLQYERRKLLDQIEQLDEDEYYKEPGTEVDDKGLYDELDKVESRLKEIDKQLDSGSSKKAGQFDYDDYRKFLEKEKAEKEKREDKRSFKGYAHNILERAKISGVEDMEVSKDGYAIRCTIPEANAKARGDQLKKLAGKDAKVESCNIGSSIDGRTNVVIRFKKPIAKNAIIQAINEIKETDMFSKLFKKKENKMDKDELKSLFMECLSELTAKNEKDEEDKKADNEEDMKADEDKKDEKEDAENKCKNDVVDKRDIIRQIMAIAGKHEDNEDVRTIAKLAEKLAYDKSEADDKADNKCKNEDEEDEDKKEKASNSIEEIVGKMSAGVNEYKPQSYLSQKKAIELGDKLF